MAQQAMTILKKILYFVLQLKKNYVCLKQATFLDGAFN